MRGEEREGVARVDRCWGGHFWSTVRGMRFGGAWGGAERANESSAEEEGEAGEERPAKGGGRQFLVGNSDARAGREEDASVEV